MEGACGCEDEERLRFCQTLSFFALTLMGLIFFVLVFLLYKHRRIFEPPKITKLPYLLKLVEVKHYFRTKKLIVDWKNIDIGEFLGSGHYATVFEGLKPNPKGQFVEPDTVALKISHPTQKSILNILIEGKVMHEAKHENIVPLKGVAFSNMMPALVMAYQDGKSLENYFLNLREGRIKNAKAEIVSYVTVGQLVYVLLCVARAMKHIHALTIKHRDIAARNVLLNFDSIVDTHRQHRLIRNACLASVKLGDFGIALHDSMGVYDDLDMPFTRLPPEILSQYQIDRKWGEYETPADVWEVGVLAFEILHMGILRPYYNAANIGDIIDRQTHRDDRGLPLPAQTPARLACLIHNSCLNVQANLRPTSEQLVGRLEEILQDDQATSIRINANGSEQSREASGISATSIDD